MIIKIAECVQSLVFPECCLHLSWLTSTRGASSKLPVSVLSDASHSCSKCVQRAEQTSAVLWFEVVLQSKTILESVGNYWYLTVFTLYCPLCRRWHVIYVWSITITAPGLYHNSVTALHNGRKYRIKLKSSFILLHISIHAFYEQIKKKSIVSRPCWWLASRGSTCRDTRTPTGPSVCQLCWPSLPLTSNNLFCFMSYILRSMLQIWCVSCFYTVFMMMTRTNMKTFMDPESRSWQKVNHLFLKSVQ